MTMPAALPRATGGYVSPFYFEFDVEHYLRTGSLDAITGQVATFTRARKGAARDTSGNIYQAVHSRPRIWYDDNGVPALLVEQSRTNVVLHNRNLTNAAWTKTNVTAEQSVTGVDGLTSSATALTATAANGTVLQAITLASSARFQTAYVRRLAGVGTINMTMDNGSTWTVITLTAAWTRFSIPTQTLANPTVGFRIVTSGDSIAVDYVQNEDGTDATSPILVGATAETRAQDFLTYAVGWSAQNITAYLDTTEFGTFQRTGTRLWQIGDDDSGTDDSVYIHCAAVGDVRMTGTFSGVSGTVSNATTGAVALGNRHEIRAIIKATMTVARTISEGTEDVGTTGSLAGNAYSEALMCLTPGGPFTGATGWRRVRVVNGERTLTEMREGRW